MDNLNIIIHDEKDSIVKNLNTRDNMLSESGCNAKLQIKLILVLTCSNTHIQLIYKWYYKNMSKSFKTQITIK